MKTIIFIVLLVFISLLLGIIIGRLSITRSDGEFLIDNSSEEKDIFRLSLEKSPEEYSKKQLLILKIIPNANLGGNDEKEDTMLQM